MSMIPKKDIRFVLVTDLDHTLVHHGQNNHRDLSKFNRIWQTRFSHDSLLVYSTGRSSKKYTDLKACVPLITPDAVVCSVGTEIYWLQNDGSFVHDEEWKTLLSSNWNRTSLLDLVESLRIENLSLQEESEQRPHKISFTLKRRKDDSSSDSDVDALKSCLEKSELDVKVVYSGGRDVDVLPKGAGKGKALHYILSHLKEWNCHPKDGVQVNGDSGNDIELFEVDGVKACVVANAMPEVMQWAQHRSASSNLFIASQECSAGIIEGMRHFGFLTGSSDLCCRLKEDVLGAVESLLQSSASHSLNYLSDKFTLRLDARTITLKDTCLDLKTLLGFQNTTSLMIDHFKMKQQDRSSNFNFMFYIHPLGDTETSGKMVKADLNVQYSEEKFLWEYLHLTQDLNSSINQFC